MAHQLGRIDAEFVRRQESLLQRLGLPVDLPTAANQPAVSADELLAAMQHDKKTESGRLRFVLPTRLGHVEIVDGIEPSQARLALAEFSKF